MSNGNSKVELQLVDEVDGDVGISKGGDVLEILGSVIRHERVHFHISIIDAKTISNSLGQVAENLAGRVLLRNDKRIIQSIIEADLNQSRVLWCRW